MIQRLNMRACWNWQTGTFEVRVLYDIWVQVPLPAPNKRTVHWAGLLFYSLLKTCLSAGSADFFI